MTCWTRKNPTCFSAQQTDRTGHGQPDKLTNGLNLCSKPADEIQMTTVFEMCYYIGKMRNWMQGNQPLLLPRNRKAAAEEKALTASPANGQTCRRLSRPHHLKISKPYCR